MLRAYKSKSFNWSRLVLLLIFPEPKYLARRKPGALPAKDLCHGIAGLSSLPRGRGRGRKETPGIVSEAW